MTLGGVVVEDHAVVWRWTVVSASQVGAQMWWRCSGVMRES